MKRFMIVLTTLLLAACASHQPVTIPAQGYVVNGVQAGDRVEVVSLDGIEHRFVVAELSPLGISDESTFYPYSEMASLSRIESNLTWKNTLKGVGMAALITVYIATAALSGASYSGFTF